MKLVCVHVIQCGLMHSCNVFSLLVGNTYDDHGIYECTFSG